MIVFPCTACGAHQRAGEHLIGRMLRCQSCNRPMQIPAESIALPAGFSRPSDLPTAAGQRAQAGPAASPAAPAPEPAGDDDLFFQHIRKGGRRNSKYV